MIGSSEYELHRALVTALEADATLITLTGGRVYDWPDGDSVFPFVTVGEIVSTPWDTNTLEGAECSVTIHTWARGDGARPQARLVGEAVSKLLHRNPEALSVTGHNVDVITRDFGTVDLEGVGSAQATSRIAHGIYRYTIKTSAA